MWKEEDNKLKRAFEFKNFKIAEITCPTKYFPEASSISFRKSIKYGLGVVGVSFKYLFTKSGICRSKLYQ